MWDYDISPEVISRTRPDQPEHAIFDTKQKNLTKLITTQIMRLINVLSKYC